MYFMLDASPDQVQQVTTPLSMFEKDKIAILHREKGGVRLVEGNLLVPPTHGRHEIAKTSRSPWSYSNNYQWRQAFGDNPSD